MYCAELSTDDFDGDDDCSDNDDSDDNKSKTYTDDALPNDD